MAKRKKGKQFTRTPGEYLELLSKELKEEIKETEHTISSLDQGESETLRKAYNIRTDIVCWGIPMDEIMYAKFFSNFMQLMKMPWDSVITTESTYLPDARNCIHNLFLETGDAPYLMMLDSDVLPPPHLVSTLLAHNKDIVGGWYRKKSRTNAHPVVYDFEREDEHGIFYKARLEAGTGMEKVDGMGAGCWLMSRELAEALGKSPYSMDKAAEDFVICRKISKLGYEMWVDWDLPCAHCGVTYV